jgi:hypothetical protein
MTDKIRTHIAATDSTNTLMVTENNDGELEVKILCAYGKTVAKINVKKQHLFSSVPVPFGQFEFPTTPGTKFTAFDPDDLDTYTYETFTNGSGGTLYGLLNDVGGLNSDYIYTVPELRNHSEFLLVAQD